MIPKTLDEICDYFDVCVIIDRIETEPCVEKSVWFLGNMGDMSVGIFPFEMTDFFFSEKELADWCVSEEGQAQLNLKAKELFEDDWDFEKQEWK